MTRNHFFLKASPLLLVLFIDTMGLGLLIPLLNTIIVDPHSAFLSFHATRIVRDALYGFTMGIFMICWFFGAAILGDLSDTIGRRKALLICLLGAFGGYFLSAIAVVIHSYVLFLVGRIIAGFTGGSQSIAQAAIVDMSPPEHKVRNLAFMILSMSLGFVFGPLLGGVLSDSQLVSWFTLATPFYFAAFISFFNMILLFFLFKESYRIKGKIRIRFHQAIHVFIAAFKHEKIKRLSLVMFTMIFGWSSYFTFSSIFMMDQYHLTPFAVAMFMMVMGFGFSLGCGFIVDYCANRFALDKTVIVTILLSALCVLLTVRLQYQLVGWIMAFLVGCVMAVAYSTLIAMFSNQVSEDEQGWVMGVTGAIMALVFGVTSMFAGLVVYIGVGVPLYLSVFGLVLSAFFLWRFRV